MPNEDVLRKRFPNCFPSEFATEILPQNLPPQQINVYRVCTMGTICKEAFLSSYEERLLGCKPVPPDWGEGPFEPGDFSVSCNDTLEGAKRPLKCLKRHHPHAILACGPASSDLGPIQRTIERELKGDPTHIDWWLYEDSDPSPLFQKVELPPKSKKQKAV